jgi:hypothetical protein
MTPGLISERRSQRHEFIETCAYLLGLGPPRNASLMPETDPKEALFSVSSNGDGFKRMEQTLRVSRPAGRNLPFRPAAASLPSALRPGGGCRGLYVGCHAAANPDMVGICLVPKSGNKTGGGLLSDW